MSPSTATVFACNLLCQFSDSTNPNPTGLSYWCACGPYRRGMGWVVGDEFFATLPAMIPLCSDATTRHQVECFIGEVLLLPRRRIALVLVG
jgi:hypothetical protein